MFAGGNFENIALKDSICFSLDSIIFKNVVTKKKREIILYYMLQLVHDNGQREKQVLEVLLKII